MDEGKFCEDCGRPAYHQVRTTKEGKHYFCCKHWVRTGHAPSDWHPECMREYAKNAIQ